ncbi:unnamed protein product [Didymodactylos carnosus]|uniref:CCHC-type domain-containing protein n=1 Tax=Didymodactylos carnosus TaxID=1234261 RepID=A0A815LCG3_9BILA|nr:unnamed protein product [Didymodactylos carnosus]CAF1408131.1 unnamed protein product [Didymodactylos carnosus]CAF4031330.1 unnamed protein product [Didymodactylos carnosus]CAF4298303.1 unnamed protein product [Didymodactylos carnosus]
MDNNDLCEKADSQMTQQAQIIHLFGGLTQNLQTLLSTQNIQTTAHFMAQIINLETAEKKILEQTYVVPQYPSPEYTYENQFITASISNQPSRLVQRQVSNVTHQPVQQLRPRDVERSNQQFVLPNNPSFYRSPTLVNSNAHYTGRPQSQICYRCGQHGHFRRECPTQPRLKGRKGQW